MSGTCDATMRDAGGHVAGGDVGEAVADVRDGGAFSTVQDRGRRGHQAEGFGTAGAMDWRALAVGNALVGNAPDAAAIEFAVSGPTLRFRDERIVALTGARARATLDGAELPHDRAVRVRPGATLAVGPVTRGAYGYLAVTGGVACLPVLGSRATAALCGIGGVGGRALRAGDRLPLGVPPAGWRDAEGRGAFGEDAYYGWRAGDGRASDVARVRVVLAAGDAFAPQTVARFLAATYAVSARSNRMGVRLRGDRVAPRVAGGIASEGIALGTIQVPDDGEPIVVCADRQTTGGYAKIATVATVDLPLFVQRAPGARVRFERIDVRDAQRLLARDVSYCRALARRPGTPGAGAPGALARA
ncbi:biotin-dependent carboxyltransferase family protein [bacterium]|nr:biotin-dependent carboxyltransferase family protein [bacterium]